VKPIARIVIWVLVAVLGAGALAKIAFDRGESLNAMWFVIAALCCYLVAYRLYSALVAARLPCLGRFACHSFGAQDDGRDFVPTNKWVLFGHHFAAIAGPGPLVGPTLAAQFGYLPGTLWLIAGAGVLPAACRTFHHSVLLDPPRRQIHRPNGARRSKQTQWLHRAARRARHSGDFAGRGRVG